MDTKTTAIMVAGFAMILLVALVIFKVRRDRKRKSLTISSGIRNKDIHVNNDERNIKQPNLWGIPSWGLALLTTFLALIVLMVLGDIVAAIFRIPENDNGDLVFYILYNLIIVVSCFFICRLNPKSIWYVPVICNLVGIISAIVEQNFWIGSLWIVICSGWVLSIIASVAGARIGSKKEVSADL